MRFNKEYRKKESCYMKLTPQELDKLKKCELKILSDFDMYCKEHGLRYYLIGGALLGAARYKNLIPWDDDIDVAMPRSDYEHLKQIYASEKYFLQNAETDPLFARCIQKLRMNGTKIIEFGTQNVNMHQGIYIDIFPIDYVDTDEPEKIAPIAKKIRKQMTLRMIKSGYKASRYAIVKKLIKLFYPVSAKRIDKKIDCLCTAQNSGKCTYAILWLHNYSWDRQIHKAEIFENGSLCQLGNEEYTAPADTHTFLLKVFGEDYMDEPPKEKQNMPHNYLELKLLPDFSNSGG